MYYKWKLQNWQKFYYWQFKLKIYIQTGNCLLLSNIDQQNTKNNF